MWPFNNKTRNTTYTELTLKDKAKKGCHHQFKKAHAIEGVQYYYCLRCEARAYIDHSRPGTPPVLIKANHVGYHDRRK